ncbi:Paraplegin [Orbilia brochopaga]|nr:Paraplegin [Drechslerella brochopaga]
MTRNYSSTENTSASNTAMRTNDIASDSNSNMAHRKSSDPVSPGSILTASDILKSHEDAFEERRRSHDGELHLPQSVVTTIEVIGGPFNTRAQRLAANLATLTGKSDNTQNATGVNADWQVEQTALQELTVPTADRPPASGSNKIDVHAHSYCKAAYDATACTSSKHKHPGVVMSSIFSHADGKYDDINAQIIASIRQAHPNSRLIPLDLWSLDIWGFCFSGHAQLQILTSVAEGTGISTFSYNPPAKRTGSGAPNGQFGQTPQYETGTINYKGAKWTAYFASWSKGFQVFKRAYIVHDLDKDGDALVEQFALDCGVWTTTPREQMWVFDRGYWQLDGALYASVMKASWADIILPEDLKANVLNDVLGFFAAEDTYRGLKMPWKRGVVFYGPPGNGKTITLKAVMKALYTPTASIPPLPLPSLYVKSLAGYGPPEFAIRDVFQKARQQAPCLLIWEDLDSIIDDSNRSFFLNELDGLEDNQGILVIGTTNHLDRLDPGIVKRPSRFDRKYLFDNPADSERVRYVDYWRKKLSGTPIDFSDDLVKELADLMKDFSFAYMKEAFVSTLLILAGRRNNKDGGDEWATKFAETIRKQIKQLREQLEAE